MAMNPYVTLLAVALGGFLTLTAGLLLERRRERMARETLLRTAYSRWLAHQIGLLAELKQVLFYHLDVKVRNTSIAAIKEKVLAIRPAFLTVLELGFDVVALEAIAEHRLQVSNLQRHIQMTFQLTDQLAHRHQTSEFLRSQTLKITDSYYQETPKEKWEQSMEDQILRLTGLWKESQVELASMGKNFEGLLEGYTTMLDGAIALRGSSAVEESDSSS